MSLISRLTLVICLCWPAMASAQVQRHILTDGIQAREPNSDLGDQVVLNGQITTLFYFTHVTNLSGEKITHRWYFEDQEVAAISLAVGSDSWRTYSSKRILPAWKGQWSVQVWHGDLKLTEHSFTVQ